MTWTMKAYPLIGKLYSPRDYLKHETRDMRQLIKSVPPNESLFPAHLTND